jgi:hypothetical protein
MLLFLAACADKNGNQGSSTADTTQVVELALKTVMTESFPEMNDVKKKNSFGDSVFLTTNLFPLAKLPSAIDSFHFKVLPDSTICTVIKSDTLSVDSLPNYLRLQAFEKTDTGYFIQFESVNCVPIASKDAAVSLHILKTKDKFVFNRK